MSNPEQPQKPKDSSPATAPEITDKSLLTVVQKQRIDDELTVDSKPRVISPVPVNENTIIKEQPVSDVVLPTDESGVTPEAEIDPKADLADSKNHNQTPETSPKPRSHRIRHFFGGYWRHKGWFIPLTLLLIVGALAAVPYSRFLIAGLLIKHPFQVVVIDDSTKKPVTSAEVSLDGKSLMTDSHGVAIVPDVKVGKRTLAINKKYYKSSSLEIVVPIRAGKGQQVNITATGRQVPITVTNKLTGKPLENVTLKAAGSEVKTDKDGKASMVLPVEKPSLSATISSSGFNTLETKLLVTDQVVKDNSFAMVPAGKVYFLSSQSGKVDVVKTDLDGSNRQTVVYGTGKEDDRNTVLLASRDWKYLALQSKRDSGQPKLYLIETDTDKMSTIDEGDATFNLIGWNDHQFVYGLNRNGVKEWEANRQAVKSFNAPKKQLLTLDQSQAEGDQANYKTQYLENYYLVKDKLVYSVRWFGYGNNYAVSGQTNSIREAAVDSLSKREAKSFPADQYDPQQFRLYEPGGLYAVYYNRTSSANEIYEYEDGDVKLITDTDVNKVFNTVYPTYLASPSGKQTFWTEQRDGRSAFFVGDADGKNGKEIASLDDYQVYGWYSDGYLLVSKKGSELYIMPVAGGTPLKVTDYHKPQQTYYGYGGGYGGL